MGGDKETSLFLFRKARMSTQILQCQMPTWMKSIDTLIQLPESAFTNYLADLETVGEVGAIRNAGLREFQVNPDAHEQDPALCDGLMELDSEAMGKALGERDPKKN